jgi:hypothetical protein
MKKSIGLWIDHRQAIIVNLTDKGGTTMRMAGVEAVDKTTDQQIEAKVREYFSPTGKTYEGL